MSRNRKWPRLFAYGDLELNVCRCTFPAGLKHADVVSALDRAGCSWKPHVASGANFTFEIPEGEEPVLNVMGLPGDGHDCSARTAGQDH